MDFVVLDTEPVAVGVNYVPIILGRPFLATSNAIINFRNGVMQVAFGNMTLELNIFHLGKKHVHLEEEGPEEVCLIDTIDEQSQQHQLQEDLIEELVEFSEDPNKTSKLFAAYGYWKKREEILLLLAEEDSGKKEDKESKKLDLKPLPIELKYAYLEKGG